MPLLDDITQGREAAKAHTNNAICSLTTYWHLKGLLAKAKRDPIYAMNNGEFHSTLYEYLTKYTNLHMYPFWSRLTPQKQFELCKYFSLQDESPMRLSITCDNQAGMILVVFSGTAAVTSNISKKENTYNIGKVFGAVDVMNKALNDPRFEDENIELLTTGVDTSYKGIIILTALLQKGSVLRLTYQGYMNCCADLIPTIVSKMNDEVIIPDDFEVPEDYMLTPEDEKCIQVRRQARDVIPGIYYDFFKSSNLLPCLASDRGSAYIRQTSLGESIVLNQSTLDEKMYIVVDGGVTLSMELNNTDGKGGIVCKLKSADMDDTDKLVVTRPSMPLYLLENGSVLQVTQNCFKIAQKEPPKADDDYGFVLPSSKQYLAKLNKTLSTSKSLAELDIKPPSRKPEAVKELYKIKLTFTKPSTYLAIPYNAIRSGLKGVDKKTRFALTNEMKSNVSKLIEKISGYTDWLTGVMVVDSETNYSIDEELKVDVIPTSWNYTFPLQGADVLLQGDEKEYHVETDFLSGTRGDVYPIKHFHTTTNLSHGEELYESKK